MAQTPSPRLRVRIHSVRVADAESPFMLGTLNQRATIRARTLSPDGGGGYTESWDVVATVWARLDPVTGSDGVAADHLESRVRHRLTLRRNAALAAGQRAEIAGRLFRIRTLIDAGPPDPFVTLLCEELP